MVSFAVRPLGTSGAASCDSCKEDRATYISVIYRYISGAESCDSCKEDRGTWASCVSREIPRLYKKHIYARTRPRTWASCVSREIPRRSPATAAVESGTTYISVHISTYPYTCISTNIGTYLSYRYTYRYIDVAPV